MGNIVQWPKNPAIGVNSYSGYPKKKERKSSVVPYLYWWIRLGNNLHGFDGFKSRNLNWEVVAFVDLMAFLSKCQVEPSKEI